MFLPLRSNLQDAKSVTLKQVFLQTRQKHLPKKHNTSKEITAI